MAASFHVNKLLSTTFPHLCVHPAKRVRQGIMVAIQGLLATYTLKESRLMLQECLCALVCDDDEEVSEASHMFLESLFSSSGRHHLQYDFTDIFNWLIDNNRHSQSFQAADVEATRGHKGSSKIHVEAFMTLHVGTTYQLAFILPGAVSHIGKVLHVSKTIISRAAGSMEAMDQALRALTKFLMIVLQDKANISSLDDSDINLNMDKLFEKLLEVVVGGEQSLSHSQKLLVLIYYCGPQLVKDRLLYSPVTAARFFDILTLCLSQNSVFAGSLDKLLLERPSSVRYLRSITELKATTIFENGKTASVEPNAYEDPNSYKIQYEYDLPWKLVRQASTAVCILNEMVFGLSDQAVDNMKIMFCNNIFGWDVMIEGIGIFNLSLKSDFVSSGFLYLSLYVLLENLICSNFQIKRSGRNRKGLKNLRLDSLPIQAEACHKHVNSELSNLKRKTMNRVDDGDHSSLEDDADKYKEQLEVVLFKLKESKSYIRMVGSISISCIMEATLLLSSLKQTACLIALDIVEDGIVALAKVEEYYKQESRTREVLIEALLSHSLHDLADTLDAENDVSDENGLLPAMNKIWLFLIASEISGNKKNALAFKSVVKKVSDIVVGIACSGVGRLRDTYVNTLRICIH
nr:ARM repeat superfamily protein [Tanacetum cinerariifolium]